MPDFIFHVMEILGTVAFAVSGAFVAIEKKMDILGVMILGITTAIGGGIIRDILMGVTPPTGLSNPLYAAIAIVVSLIVFLPKVRGKINLNHLGMVFVDAIGLGAFTVIGCETALPLHNFWLQIFLGVLTGVGGGVLRDIFAAEKPMIFVKHFYAAASLSGALLFSLLYPLNDSLAAVLGVDVIIILRLLAAKYRWHLPKA